MIGCTRALVETMHRCRRASSDSRHSFRFSRPNDTVQRGPVQWQEAQIVQSQLTLARLIHERTGSEVT